MFNVLGLDRGYFPTQVILVKTLGDSKLKPTKPDQQITVGTVCMYVCMYSLFRQYYGMYDQIPTIL